MTAAALATELEVSLRTVYRDVESLIAAGVPVYGEPGREGGYRLLDGYRTQLTGLSATEARALVLAGLPEAAAALGLSQALAAAQLKLHAATPGPHRDRSQLFGERVHIDAPAWHAEPETGPHLIALLEAAVRQHRVRVTYRSWNQAEPSPRLLEPYGVVFKAGRWYLVARRLGPESAQFRTYRVAKVCTLETLDDFDREPFDLGRHWREYTADYDARRLTMKAEIRLSPKGFRLLQELPDAALVQAARAAADLAGQTESAGPTEHAAGWIRATIPIESVELAGTLLLGLGAEVEVLAPPELRRRMADSAQALLDLYSRAAISR
jgi:predicted DNA-binding transcriptional regulator YafY